MAEELTHLSGKGVQMVEVGDKPIVYRSAIAKGRIYLDETTIKLIEKEEIKKGNVQTTTQIAAINAVKSTHHLIPLCHSLKITGIEVDFQVLKDYVEVTVKVNSKGETGVEMEALTGASIGLLTVWDMVKSIEKDANGQYHSTRITDIIVTEKIKD